MHAVPRPATFQLSACCGIATCSGPRHLTLVLHPFDDQTAVRLAIRVPHVVRTVSIDTYNSRDLPVSTPTVSDLDALSNRVGRRRVGAKASWAAALVPATAQPLPRRRMVIIVIIVAADWVVVTVARNHDTLARLFATLVPDFGRWLARAARHNRGGSARDAATVAAWHHLDHRRTIRSGRRVGRRGMPHPSRAHILVLVPLVVHNIDGAVGVDARHGALVPLTHAAQTHLHLVTGSEVTRHPTLFGVPVVVRSNLTSYIRQEPKKRPTRRRKGPACRRFWCASLVTSSRTGDAPPLEVPFRDGVRARPTLHHPRVNGFLNVCSGHIAERALRLYHFQAADDAGDKHHQLHLAQKAALAEVVHVEHEARLVSHAGRAQQRQTRQAGQARPSTRMTLIKRRKRDGQFQIRTSRRGLKGVRLNEEVACLVLASLELLPRGLVGVNWRLPEFVVP
mmetsp:Transcript_9419/g.33126  ORF Transcript_9419/g.33126 Transcript_9419/m.33126 type:complete len:452 (-) Transcript_9419:277-1632(-)